MIGTKLAHYEITSHLGSGGMGDVYQATDSKLGRSVAIKFLPEAFSHDNERVARFEREARVLASLNHPNIAAIYGLEQSATQNFLVMELVGGENLAERIKRGPIPVDEALGIAKQIAEALEAAHEKGVIHRDLKPANIKLAPDGKVKVLDFGLAKVFDNDDPGTSNSPTLLSQTAGGVVLGTVPYMSPEQVRGRTVDRRTDIWAFGCVLYEMLTGKQAFTADTVSDTIAIILGPEPNWNVLPTSDGIRALLRRCLQKDLRRRVQHIGDVRVEIEDLLTAAEQNASQHPAVESAAPHWKRIRRWSFAGVMAIAAVGMWYVAARPKTSIPFPVIRSQIPFRTDSVLRTERLAAFALSPDGKLLVYVVNRGGKTQLYLRRMDQFDETALPGTEGGNGPFFSPDSQWLGFFAGDKLMKVSLSNGRVLPICNVGSQSTLGGTWAADDTIIFGSSAGLSRVPASGGNGEVVSRVGAWPEILPSGKDVLFVHLNRGSFDDASLAVLSLETGKVTTLNQKGTNPRYARSGHLLFARSRALWAVPFDVKRLETRGAAVNVVDNVSESTSGGANFSLSSDGSLVYAPEGSKSEGGLLVWVDRHGQSTPLPFPSGIYADARLSPSGERLALTINGQDVWIYDVVRGSRTRLTANEGDNFEAIWSPDAASVVFGSNRAGLSNLFSKLADGRGNVERLTTSTYEQYPNSWVGDVLVFSQAGDHGIDTLVMSMKDTSRKADPFLNESYGEWSGKLSPDGRFMAYVSDESGRTEIYVQSYPDRNLKIPISTEGGTEPLWGHDGKELFYRNGEKMMVVSFAVKPTVSASLPRLLFEERYESSAPGYTSYDIHPNGQRFVMIKPVGQTPNQEIRVVINWFEELKQRVPVR